MLYVKISGCTHGYAKIEKLNGNYVCWCTYAVEAVVPTIGDCMEKAKQWNGNAFDWHRQNNICYVKTCSNNQLIFKDYGLNGWAYDIYTNLYKC